MYRGIIEAEEAPPRPVQRNYYSVTKSAKTMKKYLIPIIILALTLLGLFFRVYKLDQVPFNLNRDELSIGYNAYSLTVNSRDEHGVGPWPLNFQAFGDYKLPGMIYITALSIKLLGLSVWAIRLPNALLTTLLIPVSYFLGKKFLDSKWAAVILTFLLTFSMWHINGARTIYEPIIGLTFSSIGLYFLFNSLNNIKHLFIANIFFAISFFIYNVPLLLLPLLIVVFIIIRNPYFLKFKVQTVIFLAIYFLSAVSFLAITSGVNASRSNTTILTNKEIETTVVENITQLHTSQLPMTVARVFANKPWEIGNRFVHGYLAAYSPTYLFETGDGNAWHNLRSLGYGNMQYILLPFIGVGIYSALKSKNKSHLFLLAYLVLSPIPDALTVDAPITNRLLDFHFALLMLAALGIYNLIDQSKKNNYFKLFLAGSFIFYLATFSQFCVRYFYTFEKNLTVDWRDGVRLLAEQVASVEDQYDKIYVSSQIDMPYIYFVFFGKYNPVKFQQSAVWIKDGFDKAIEFNPYQVTHLAFPGVTGESMKRISEVFPEGVNKVLYISKIDDRNLNINAKIIITDYEGKELWQAEELSLEMIRDYYQAATPSAQRNLMLDYVNECINDSCPDPEIYNLE